MFAVKDGELRTPALSVGILDGVTRGKVIGLARANEIAVREVEFMSPDELRTAEEVFLTSAARGVLPVTQVDVRPVGAVVPGPVTRRMMTLYARLTERDAR